MNSNLEEWAEELRKKVCLKWREYENKLPKGFELAPFVSFENDWYNGPATALETSNRLDQKWRTGAALTWHITDAWSVETSYQYTHNNSESPLYRYDQSLVSLGVAWSF